MWTTSLETIVVGGFLFVGIMVYTLSTALGKCIDLLTQIRDLLDSRLPDGEAIDKDAWR